MKSRLRSACILFRDQKKKAQEGYRIAQKAVKASIKKDKRTYVDNLATKGEEAALKGNLRELYDITRKLTGKWKQSNRPIRDAKGKLLASTEEQAAAWAEHF